MLSFFRSISHTPSSRSLFYSAPSVPTAVSSFAFHFIFTTRLAVAIFLRYTFVDFPTFLCIQFRFLSIPSHTFMLTHFGGIANPHHVYELHTKYKRHATRVSSYDEYTRIVHIKRRRRRKNGRKKEDKISKCMHFVWQAKRLQICRVQWTWTCFFNHDKCVATHVRAQWIHVCACMHFCDALLSIDKTNNDWLTNWARTNCEMDSTGWWIPEMRYIFLDSRYMHNNASVGWSVLCALIGHERNNNICESREKHIFNSFLSHKSRMCISIETVSEHFYAWSLSWSFSTLHLFWVCAG